MNHYASEEERVRLIAGLRDLAHFLETTLDVPTPWGTDVLVFPPKGTNTEMRAEIDAIASRIGTQGHWTAGGHYTASRWFGPVEYRAVAIPNGNPESE